LRFVSIIDTRVKNISTRRNKPHQIHVHSSTRAFRAPSSFLAIANVATAFNRAGPHFRAFFGLARCRVRLLHAVRTRRMYCRHPAVMRRA
jgi:hypothetical protein